MMFQSKWITTREFAELPHLNLYHKELVGTDVVPGTIKNSHVHFRKRFCFDRGDKAILRVSADDYYKLYVNGQFVAQGPAPAYVEGYNYNEVDVTAYLQPGENVFAVHVYYQGLVNRVWNSGDNRQGMIADFLVDGKFLLGTDDTWRYEYASEYKKGHKIGYQTQYMENIDFNEKATAWKQLDFSEEGYCPAVVLDGDDHVFRKKPVACLDVYSVYPQKMVRLAPGKWFLDFGTEVVGQIAMKVRGKKGQCVRVLCGEETIEGEPFLARYQMRCNCNYEEICILSGEEDDFEFFDYKAFRYVNIISEDGELEPIDLRVIARHHAFREICSLESNIPWLEDIWKLCVNSLKWGTQEGFLDCPSREKGQYVGDFTVSGLAYMYVTGDAEMYRKTLYDFAESARICRGLLCVTPGNHMQEIADFSLMYPMQLYHYYHYTKDAGTLQELYPVAEGVLEYFLQYEREDGLLQYVNEKWNLVDWPTNLRDGYDLPGEEHGKNRPCHNVLNAYYIGALEYMEKIRLILGYEVNGASGIEKRKQAFLKAFYDGEKGVFRDTETSDHAALHSNVLPIFFGIAPSKCYNTVKILILEKGLKCGTMFSYFVLKALGKMGAYEEELALLLNESEQSWINMLREGATTCFEAWGKDQKANTSLCHPWGCAPIIVLIEDILKVDPAMFGADGEKTILKL